MFVRQMTVSDIDSVYDIAYRSLDERYPREMFLFLISGWPAGQLVATNDLGSVIGFLSGARLSSDKASIQLFAVDSSYRGKGTGSRLLEEFRFRTSTDRKLYIQLEVKKADVGTVSFYRNRGFNAVAYLDNFYNNGAAAVRMICCVYENS